jgi:hypothetical protein
MAGAVHLVTGKARAVDPDELVRGGELHDVTLRVMHPCCRKTCQWIREHHQRADIRLRNSRRRRRCRWCGAWVAAANQSICDKKHRYRRK